MVILFYFSDEIWCVSIVGRFVVNCDYLVIMFINCVIYWVGIYSECLSEEWNVYDFECGCFVEIIY